VRGPSPPRALVLGSSRVLPFDETDVRELTGLGAVNLGVSVSCPIDYIAQLRRLLDAGMAPAVMIVGVDELAFGNNPEADIYDMQLATHPETFAELDLRDRVPIIARILQTLTVASTHESARNLWSRWVEGEVFAAGAREDAGSQDWTGMPVTERRARLAAGIEDKVAFWGKYLDTPSKVEDMRPTARKVRLWNDLLDLAGRRGIAVYATLLPAHPDFVRRTFSPRLLEIRAELSELLAESCARHGFTYRDDTDLASFGGAPEDFADGTHMLRPNGRRLLRALLGASAAP